LVDYLLLFSCFLVDRSSTWVCLLRHCPYCLTTTSHVSDMSKSDYLPMTKISQSLHSKTNIATCNGSAQQTALGSRRDVDFRLVPDRADCEGTTTVVVLFDKDVEKSGDVSALFSDSGVDTGVLSVSVERLNDRAFSLVAPRHTEGEVHVTFCVAGKSIGRRQRLTYVASPQIYRLARGLSTFYVRQLAAICGYVLPRPDPPPSRHSSHQRRGGQHGGVATDGPTEAAWSGSDMDRRRSQVDRAMANAIGDCGDGFGGSDPVPAFVYEELFGIYRSCSTSRDSLEDDDGGVQDADPPTLLHLAAAYGLTALAVRLTDLPDSELAVAMRDVTGRTPRDVAADAGHANTAAVFDRKLLNAAVGFGVVGGGGGGEPADNVALRISRQFDRTVADISYRDSSYVQPDGPSRTLVSTSSADGGHYDIPHRLTSENGGGRYDVVGFPTADVSGSDDNNDDDGSLYLIMTEPVTSSTGSRRHDDDVITPPRFAAPPLPTCHPVVGDPLTPPSAGCRATTRHCSVSNSDGKTSDGNYDVPRRDTYDVPPAAARWPTVGVPKMEDEPQQKAPVVPVRTSRLMHSADVGTGTSRVTPLPQPHHRNMPPPTPNSDSPALRWSGSVPTTIVGRPESDPGACPPLAARHHRPDVLNCDDLLTKAHSSPSVSMEGPAVTTDVPPAVAPRPNPRPLPGGSGSGSVGRAVSVGGGGTPAAVQAPTPPPAGSYFRRPSLLAACGGLTTDEIARQLNAPVPPPLPSSRASGGGGNPRHT
jgi:hypothetical protein